MAASRMLRWTALTCRYERVDIFFGLAATLDDDLAQKLRPRQIMAFPYLSIRVAEGTERQIPLRYYAVRDESIVIVRPLPGGPIEDGYQRVSLEFQLDALGDEADDEETDVTAERPGEPVMAFVLSLGLGPDEDQRFFNEVIKQFLHHTWMTLPRLLRQLGCLPAGNTSG